MRTFKINRRVVTDQTLFVKAATAEEAMEKAESFTGDVGPSDKRIVKSTHRHLGEA